jgi:Domain of unknown function (DUF4440)
MRGAFAAPTSVSQPGAWASPLTTCKRDYMLWHWLSLIIGGILAGSASPGLGTRNAPAIGPETLTRRVEVARLRAHFDSVTVELRSANAPSLSLSQRRARATLMGWLQEYRDAGRFPRNVRFPELALPFFRDDSGVLCAMAYLIDQTGRRDLVDRVAVTRNNAFIAELADDSELRAWLDSVGLSVTEAARIQPSYPPAPLVPTVAQYDSAWKQRDTSAVSRLLAQQYQYFTSDGRVSSRAETMSMLSSRDSRLVEGKRSEIVVTESGRVAIVSSRWVGHGTYRGRPFKDDQRCGQTWLQTDDMTPTWQLLSEHCVQITPETATPAPD